MTFRLTYGVSERFVPFVLLRAGMDFTPLFVTRQDTLYYLATGVRTGFGLTASGAVIPRVQPGQMANWLEAQAGEDIILDALRDRLMRPEQVAIFVSEFTAEWNRLQAEAASGQENARRELDTINRKIDGLVDAIAEGLRGAGLQQRLNGLEARKAALERSLTAAAPPSLRLHPNLSEVYASRVASLREALNGPDGTEALERTRELIERVVVRPTTTGGIEIELIGALGAMLELAAGHKRTGDRGSFGSSVQVVAGARVTAQPTATTEWPCRVARMAW